MNKESKKLSWAVGLVAGLGVLSIAYAALSSTLYINGSGEVKAGTVEFTSCVPSTIGTNDTSVNTGDGASLSGTYSTTTGYVWSSNEAKAFGAAAPDTSLVINRDAAYSAPAANAKQIQIFRNTEKTSNHYSDSLTITGTELYDYGAYVIYDATLQNMGQNAMKLTKVPVIKAYFTPEGGNQEAADSNIKVKLYADLAEAQKPAGTELTARTNETTTTNGNYLAKNGNGDTTHWYIKVFRRNGSEVGNGTSPATPLRNGSFSFTTNLSEDPAGGNVAVWETAEATS